MVAAVAGSISFNVGYFFTVAGDSFPDGGNICGTLG